MNLEIATRLVELRKQHGLSQEELAEKLGVSRQAVSKWERVEAAPDTDNLIALAKLYGVSLDELLNYTPENKSEKTADVGENNKDNIKDNENDDEYDFSDDKKQQVHIGKNGIHLKDGEDEVHLSWDKGIHIVSSDDGREVNVEKHAHKKPEPVNPVAAIIDGVAFILTAIAYIVAGVLTGLWHPLWVMFFFSGIFSVFADPKRLNSIFPFLVVGSYLIIGFVANAWHPGWVIFLLIPAYYSIYDAIKKSRKMKTKTDENVRID